MSSDGILDFEEIPSDVESAVIIETALVGYRPIDVIRKSTHPDKAHLYIALCELAVSHSEDTFLYLATFDDKEKSPSNFVVWTYDSNINTLLDGKERHTYWGALCEMSQRISVYQFVP